MKERPILFSGAMVRAILDGSKTQTRRVIKNNPIEPHPVEKAAHYHTGDPSQGYAWYWRDRGCWNSSKPFFCPYGHAGDRLWVRETHRLIDYSVTAPGCYPVHDDWQAIYKADNLSEFIAAGRWRPSIHMPRWASRIALEITGVRIERLQEISEEDALAEGIEKSSDPSLSSWPFLGANHLIKGTPKPHATAGQAFLDVWGSIYGAMSGIDNPWVWVIEFKRVQA